MSDSTWRPLFEDGGEAAETYDSLVEGVPPWLQSSVAAWLRDNTTGFDYDQTLENLRTIERGLRWNLNWKVVQQNGAVSALMLVANSDNDLLKLADFTLATLISGYAEADRLSLILEHGGSAWTVGTRADRHGLVRRVPEGVQLAAEATFGHGAAGRLLRQAWAAVFGIDPNPSEAYRLAVKAVEAAAIPVVSPTNDRATLGTVIRTIEDQKNWTLPFDREHNKSPTGEVLLGMLRTLWHGQHDRHAGGDPDLPLSVSAAEAEAAVTMAVPLVQWFTNRAAARR